MVGPLAQKALMLLGVGLLLVLCRFVANVVYNLYFHPLRHYPGPKLYAATRLKWWYEHVQQRLPWSTTAIHKKYGPVVRMAPNELSYITPGAWNTIYGHRQQEMSKTTDGTGIPVNPNGIDSLITADRPTHARLRRSVAHAFSEKALREQEHLIHSHMTAFVKALRKVAPEGPQDMVRWLHFLTFDVIGDLAFGESFGCLEMGNMHVFTETILDINRVLSLRQFAFYLGLERLFFILAGNTILRSTREAFQFAAETVRKRISAETDRPDFMTYILRHNGEKGLSHGEMDSMASLLVNAGSDTTATILAGTIYYLARDQSIYNKLADEIRGRFKSDDEITMISVNHLEYTIAVLNETHRLYPPAAGIIPRVVPGDGEMIEGKFVPGGTAVAIPMLAAYRHESNFHRAEEFIPERWIDKDPKSPFGDDRRAVLQPFSYGPRNCAGKNLAIAETRLTIAKIMYHFDFEFAADMDVPGWKKQQVNVTWIKKPLMMKLKPRTVS